MTDDWYLNATEDAQLRRTLRLGLHVYDAACPPDNAVSGRMFAPSSPPPACRGDRGRDDRARSGRSSSMRSRKGEGVVEGGRKSGEPGPIKVMVSMQRHHCELSILPRESPAGETVRPAAAPGFALEREIALRRAVVEPEARRVAGAADGAGMAQQRHMSAARSRPSTAAAFARTRRTWRRARRARWADASKSPPEARPLCDLTRARIDVVITSASTDAPSPEALALLGEP